MTEDPGQENQKMHCKPHGIPTSSTKGMSQGETTASRDTQQQPEWKEALKITLAMTFMYK